VAPRLHDGVVWTAGQRSSLGEYLLRHHKTFHTIAKYNEFSGKTSKELIPFFYR
jgi:hypothetical protein